MCVVGGLIIVYKSGVFSALGNRIKNKMEGKSYSNKHSQILQKPNPFRQPEPSNNMLINSR